MSSQLNSIVIRTAWDSWGIKTAVANFAVWEDADAGLWKVLCRHTISFVTCPAE